MKQDYNMVKAMKTHNIKGENTCLEMRMLHIWI